MKAQGPWLVVKCDESTSKITNSDMTTITMINTHSEIAHSYVDHNNKNYTHWTNVIKGFELGWGITIDNLHYKTKSGVVQQRHIKVHNIKENLIDADSLPRSVSVDDTLQQAVDKLVKDLGL